MRSVNVTLGPKEERLLLTGLHCVADISCINCQTVMGWMYVSALRHQPFRCLAHPGTSCTVLGPPSKLWA